MAGEGKRRVAGGGMEKVFREQSIPDVVCYVKELNNVIYEHGWGDTIYNFYFSSSAFVRMLAHPWS